MSLMPRDWLGIHPRRAQILKLGHHLAIVKHPLMRALAITLCLLATPALADVAGVASVIDGDTIEVHGQPIRLHGIDAPIEVAMKPTCYAA